MIEPLSETGEPGLVALVRPTANLRRVLELTATESLLELRDR
jgi:hypothetical protein